MTKKKSIREFLSEDDLKFQLYLLKYSQQLKNIEEKTEEEIIEQFNEDTKKRLNLIEKQKEKISDANIIAMDALNFNKIYVESWKPPSYKEDIHLIFEQKRNNYVNFLTNMFNEKERKQDKIMLEYAKSVELKSVVSKEKFGQMLLLLIKNMGTMPSFSGYTENWKTDFFSNAIEKTLLYAHNFDEELLSKRTGEKSKAFAYITQICFNAFVNIINIRKAEAEFLKDTISLETANLDGLKYYPDENTSDIKEEFNFNDYLVIIENDNDDIQTFINEKINSISKDLEKHNNNKHLLFEINQLKIDTPEEEKTKDFYEYIYELETKVQETEYSPDINHIIFQKPKGFKLPKDFILPEADFSISIRGPKERLPKKEIEKDLFEIDEIDEIDELQEFNDEWTLL